MYWAEGCPYCKRLKESLLFVNASLPEHKKISIIKVGFGDARDKRLKLLYKGYVLVPTMLIQNNIKCEKSSTIHQVVSSFLHRFNIKYIKSLTKDL